MCEQVKEDWLNKECEELERSIKRKCTRKWKNCVEGKHLSPPPADAYSQRIVQSLWKRRRSGKYGQSIQDLYNSDRDKNFEVECLDERPDIMKEELRRALKEMKPRKATGSDESCTELIEALEEFDAEHLTKVLNKIYSTCGASSYRSEHFTVHLSTKEAWNNRVWATSYNQPHDPNNKINAQNHHAEDKKQDPARKSRRTAWFCGRKGRDKRHNILRTLVERATEVQEDLYLCFIDYTKDIDTIKQKISSIY